MLKLNTFFSLALVFCSHWAFAFKGEERVGIGTQNAAAFESMEFRLDGSSMIRNVQLYPACINNRIKLSDRDAEIIFYAQEKICMSLNNKVARSHCGIVTGDAEISKVSSGLVTRYEVTHLENLRDDCPFKPRPGKSY